MVIAARIEQLNRGHFAVIVALGNWVFRKQIVTLERLRSFEEHPVSNGNYHSIMSEISTAILFLSFNDIIF
ncbi:hypothetical protein AC249_AIPGENE16516 [Exaiptasia diaphana]|nr:hypothetical protein AC249_AIPGENE16516 [Exaiptasia diaphana]